MGSDTHQTLRSAKPALPGRPRPRHHVTSGGFPIPFSVTSRRGASQWVCRPAAPGNSAAPPPPAACPARRPPQPRAPCVQPGLRPQPCAARRSVIAPADRAVRLPGLPSCALRPERALGLSVPTGRAMPSRRTPRASAPELGALGKPSGTSGAGLGLGVLGALGVICGRPQDSRFGAESTRVAGTLREEPGRRQRMVKGPARGTALASR